MTLNRLVTSAAIMLLIGLCGCSLIDRDDLFKNGRYRLEVDQIEDCTLDAISYEKEGQLFIEGNMTLRHHSDAPLSGDTRIQIIGPDGSSLQLKTTPFEPLPHSRHGHPAARFQFIFDQIPPPGSVIKLTHSLRPYDRSVDSVIR